MIDRGVENTMIIQSEQENDLIIDDPVVNWLVFDASPAEVKNWGFTDSIRNILSIVFYKKMLTEDDRIKLEKALDRKGIKLPDFVNDFKTLKAFLYVLVQKNDIIRYQVKIKKLREQV